MVDYLIKSKTLTDIADAIRSKTGVTGGITVGEMANSISSITESVEIDLNAEIEQQSIEISNQDNIISQIQAALEGKAANSGFDTSDATITSGAQMLDGVVAYGANGKVTGSITRPADASNVTLTTTDLRKVIAGKNDTDGINGFWKVVNSDSVERICTAIPEPGYYDGDIIGVPASDVLWNLTNDTSATADDIAIGKTAYVNGVKVTGTHECTSDGASIDTCTININNYLGETLCFEMSVFNGSKIEKYVMNNPGPSYGGDGEVIENVVCNSIILITPFFAELYGVDITINGEIYSFDSSGMYCLAYAPSEAGTFDMFIDYSNTQDV